MKKDFCKSKITNGILAVTMISHCVNPALLLAQEVDSNETSLEANEVNEKSTQRIKASIVETGVVLSGDDNDIVKDSWGNFNDIKTLRIEVDFSGLDKAKTVSIKIGQGLMLRTEPIKLVDGKQVVSVDTSNYKKDVIPTVNAGNLIAEHGTIELNISDDRQYVSLDVLVSIDERLYNTQNGQIISTDALTISAQADSKVLDKKRLDQVSVKGSVASSLTTGTRTQLVTDTKTHYDLTAGIAGFNSDIANIKRFYKEVEIRTTIPYVKRVENGVEVKVYAEVSDVTSAIKGTHKIVGNEIISTFENVYATGVKLDYYFYYDDSLFKDGEIVYHEDGETWIKGYQDDELFVKQQKRKYTGTLGSIKNEKITLTSLNMPIFRDDNNFFHIAGGFSIANKAGKTKPKNIRIDYPYGDSALVGAGTVKLMMPTEAVTNLEIRVELWNKRNNQIYATKVYATKGVTSASTGYTLSLSSIKKSLGLENEEIYFKSIDYDIDSFSVGYDVKGPYRTPGNTGIYLVKYFHEREGKATDTTATFSLSDIDKSTGQKTLIDKKSSKPSFSNTGTTTAGLISGTEFRDLSGNSLSAKSVVAGDGFYLYSRTEMSSYLYYNSNFLKNPMFRVRVPEGVEVDFENVFFSFNSNFSQPLEFDCVNQYNPTILKDGSKLYNFVFKDKSLVIGGINEGFTMNSNNIYAKIYMKTRKNIKALALDTKETIFLDSENMTITTGGSWDSYRTQDVYDVNQNGSYSDWVITTSVSKITTVVPDTWVDSKMSLTLNNTLLSSTNVDLKRYKDVFKLNLRIANDKDWVVKKDDFRYYIPVPKKGIAMSKMFNASVQEINLKLDGASVSDNLKIMYSTSKEAYLEPDNATYKEGLPNNLNDVTMIKVVLEKDLAKEEDEEIEVRYTYNDDESLFDMEANLKSVFSPYGWLKMELNGASIAGYDTFEQVRVTVNPIILEQPKNMTVNAGETAKTSFKSDEAGLKIQWQKYDTTKGSWVNVEGQTNKELSVTNTQLNQNNTSYRAVVRATDGTERITEPVTLTVLGYSVVIPKTISLNPLNGEGEYEILLKGNLTEQQTLEVVPDSSFMLKDEKGKSDIEARVSQEKTSFRRLELDVNNVINQKGKVAVPNLSSGKWSGKFNFNISLK